MAILKDTFISDEAEDLSFEPVPPETYICQVVDSDLRVTKSGNGEYISLTWEIIEGKYSGKKIFSNLNIVNPNEKAVQIAKSFLKQMCKAMGIEELQDTQELHGQPVQCVVKIKEASGGYDAQNVISSVKPLDGESGDPWTE